MIAKIKKYLTDNKKNFYHKFAVLALVILIIGLFYSNFILAKETITDLINAEKKTHANEVCGKLNETQSEVSFILEKLNQLKNQGPFLSKDQRREIIREKHSLESKIRHIELARMGFQTNDFSLKFFSWEKTVSDELFFQVKNLPIFGASASKSLENIIYSNYLTKNQFDIAELELKELEEKIETIKEAIPFCE